jgi:uncharacterized membrane protein YkvA (DUF1232 family)
VGVTKALGAWKQRARQLKVETYALYLACKDPRTPWYARLFIALVVWHTLSPIDLIPDFIPILGYLDDLILVPVGVALALKMIPPHVLAESREKARETMSEGKPTSWVAAGVIIALWLVLAAMIVLVVVRAFRE